jgi:hypothetical protein
MPDLLSINTSPNLVKNGHTLAILGNMGKKLDEENKSKNTKLLSYCTEYY